MKTGALLLIFLALCLGAESLRVLGVFTTTWHYKYILGASLMKGLAKNGHDVTVLSPFFEPLLPENFTYNQIILKELLDEREKMKHKHGLLENQDANIFTRTRILSETMLEWSEKILRHPRTKEFLSGGNQFDVVIVEDYLNPVHKAIAAHFEAPLIVFSTLGPNFWINEITGNPAPPSYIPDAFLGFPSKMGFFERLTNGFINLYQQYNYYYQILPRHEELRKKYIPKTPPLQEIIANTSLVLLNSHPSIHQAVPLVPNVIEVGGLHLRSRALISMDVKDFMEDGYYGVVYLNLGSDIQLSDFSNETRKSILEVLGGLRQQVLWRIEETDLVQKEDLPENVMIRRWFPQIDILSQDDIRLVITNCDVMTVTEAVDREIPILAIPILGEQFGNAQYVAERGFGTILPYKDFFNKDLLRKKIHEVLNKKKYRRNVRKAKDLLNDRIETPMNTAVFWVEYVARHEGTPHLRVAGLDLHWVKYFLIDVIAFLSAVLLVPLYLSCALFRRWRKKKANAKKENAKKDNKKEKKQN